MAENDPRPDDDSQDPFSKMFGQFFGAGGQPGTPDQAGMQAMFGQLQNFFGAMAQGNQGPVNWTLAEQSATQALSDDAPVTADDTRDVTQAAQLAQLWLEPATEFADLSTQSRALRRGEWIKASIPQWQGLTEPVAQSAADSITASLATQLPEELKGMLGQGGGMFASLGGALFGAQLGQAVGSLSSEVLSGTDLGLPMAGDSFSLLPQNIAAFGEGLELPRQEVLLYLALREAAHQRLFHGTPWLRAHVVGLVHDYAAGISFDMQGIQDRLAGIDPTDPAALQAALGSGLAEPSTTPAQQATLERLETILALIEGWVDAVVTQASANLPAAAALRETLRRRRALGGPAEQAFASIVGLQLRPRRAREAAALWEKITADRGVAERDALWAEPGLVPTAEDLDDPNGFFERRALLGATDADFDAAMAAWLDGPSADNAEGTDGPEDPGTGAQDGDEEPPRA